VKLLRGVGEKLCIMELQEDHPSVASDYEAFAKEATASINQIQTGNGGGHMDPLEKVARWQVVDKSSNLPSGYGSTSTSPTPASANGLEKVKVSSERSSFEQGSPGDLDSGCPASERNPRLLKHVGVVTTEADQRPLPSVAASPGSLASVKELHSITDLSSDEQSCINDQRIEDEIERLKEANNLTINLSSTPKKNDNSHNSTSNLDYPNSNPVTPRGSTMILAQQIDQEIIELRNFFEDHRYNFLHTPIFGCAQVRETFAASKNSKNSRN
jgi:hypothetical protein